MSWIITKDSMYFECRSIDKFSLLTYSSGFIQESSTTWTSSRDAAKRFETKADAKTVQDKYNLGGSIIPA